LQPWSNHNLLRSVALSKYPLCRKLARTLKFSITHIRRECNSEANGLANHAVRLRMDL
jgi:hypothetical protein